MDETNEASSPRAQQGPVDAVLLIDGDNDPHLPPDFPLTPHTLVRVFLRPDAKMPRTLERHLSPLPLCTTVISTKGGANAADFVMSLHAGILHSTLPMHLPFTMVTADASLGVMAQELQRLGRVAVLWTSHPEKNVRRRAVSRRGSEPVRTSSPGAPKPASSRRRGGRRGGGRGRSRASSPAPEVPSIPAGPLEPQTVQPPPARDGRTLASVAATYAARLAKMKDPPSRLKALLNDIKNRASGGGFAPEDILVELQRSHGLVVDDSGKVHRG